MNGYLLSTNLGRDTDERTIADTDRHALPLLYRRGTEATEIRASNACGPFLRFTSRTLSHDAPLAHHKYREGAVDQLFIHFPEVHNRDFGVGLIPTRWHSLSQ